MLSKMSIVPLAGINPVFMFFLIGTTYIMQKKILGNDHRVWLQVVFLVVLQYKFYKTEYCNFYAFFGRHNLYYSKN